MRTGWSRAQPSAASAAVAAALLCACLVSPGPAAAEEATRSVAPTATSGAKRSRPATRTYDLSFTLPTYGKSGCLVCHGDDRLVKVGLETTSSIYVDREALNASAHTADTPCTGCHLDFAYTSPHVQTAPGQDWRSAAKSACKNCHTEAFSPYANGAHSPAGKPGVTQAQLVAARRAAGKPEQVPLCGDCHGGHSIPASTNVEAQRAFRRSGMAMCGSERCHAERARSYDDYYHGAAYRRGALDAPACWDCHGYHEVLPADERESLVHPSRLAQTCGQEGCHSRGEITDEFLAYAALIHNQRALKSANIVNATVQRIRSGIGSVLRSVSGWF